jgi:hypothetical protein
MPTAPEITSLESLSLAELRREWADRFGAPPALRSPDLLRIVLAWRIQAKVHGGLNLATRRKLKRNGPVFAEGLDLGPGTALMRRWQGQTEEVIVGRHGFRWKGNSFPSLSAVALAMTGTRRNGPKFFGLRRGSR